MNIWKSLSGMVEIELTSAILPETLMEINAGSVEILELYWKNELTCRFITNRRNLKQLTELAEKRGETLKICNRQGLYWRIRALRKRPILIVGILILLALTILIPRQILFIRVEGNQRVPTQEILEAAEKIGIVFGASRRDVRSEKVKNAVLSIIPDLQWVGINTSGCVARISVRERFAEAEKESEYPVTRIVAARDGYILSGTVAQGTGLFQPGQTVRKGQLLISGYTDCDFCIRAGMAEGEILAQTNRIIQSVTPEKFLCRIHNQGRKQNISLLIGKKRINLWKDSGISYATCGRMYSEYYVTLPGGFQLPFAVCVDTYTQWETVEESENQAETGRALRNFSREYLQGQMIAGTIRSASEKITKAGGVFQLCGSYICEEMIGREQPEEIGVVHGKNH